MASTSRFIAGEQPTDRKQVLHRVQAFYALRNRGGEKGDSQQGRVRGEESTGN